MIGRIRLRIGFQMFLELIGISRRSNTNGFGKYRNVGIKVSIYRIIDESRSIVFFQRHRTKSL